jgi:hypothetical protein
MEPNCLSLVLAGIMAAGSIMQRSDGPASKKREDVGMLLTPGIDHFLDGREFGQQLSG